MSEPSASPTPPSPDDHPLRPGGIRRQRLAPRVVFFQRLGASIALALALMAVSLIVGVLGYHFLGGLGWVDAFLNAAMILAGMGEVSPLDDAQGKVFAGIYALYCGLALVAIAGMILAPILHRFMRRFHLEDEQDFL